MYKLCVRGHLKSFHSILGVIREKIKIPHRLLKKFFSYQIIIYPTKWVPFFVVQALYISFYDCLTHTMFLKYELLNRKTKEMTFIHSSSTNQSSWCLYIKTYDSGCDFKDYVPITLCTSGDFRYVLKIIM